MKTREINESNIATYKHALRLLGAKDRRSVQEVICSLNKLAGRSAEQFLDLLVKGAGYNEIITAELIQQTLNEESGRQELYSGKNKMLVREISQEGFKALQVSIEASKTQAQKNEVISQQFSIQDKKYKLFQGQQEGEGQSEKDMAKSYLYASQLAQIIGDIEGYSFEQNIKHAYQMLVYSGSDLAKVFDRLIIHYLDSAQPVNKAFEGFILPQDGTKVTLQFWQKLFLGNNPQKPMSIFQYADRIERQKSILNSRKIEGELVQLAPNAHCPPDDLDDAFCLKACLKYPKALENMKLALLFDRFDISQLNFDAALDIVSDRGNLRIKTEDNLPNVSLPYERNGTKYWLVKLPPSDLNTFVIGHLIGHCMSINGNAKQCIRDALSEPNNGLYVLLKRFKKNSQCPLLADGAIDYKSYEIIGSGYAWKGYQQVAGQVETPELDSLTFDSWDNIRTSDDPIIVEMLPSWAKIVAEGNYGIKRVNIGKGSKTPAHWKSINAVTEPESIGAGFFYGDAKEQVSVWRHCGLQKWIQKGWFSLEEFSSSDIPKIQYFASDEAEKCYNEGFIAPKEFLRCPIDKMPYLITQSALECYQLGLNMRDLVETSYFLETIQLVTSESALTCYRNEWVSPSILLNHDLLRKHRTELIKILISEQAQVCYSQGWVLPTELDCLGRSLSLEQIQTLFSAPMQECYQLGTVRISHFLEHGSNKYWGRIVSNKARECYKLKAAVADVLKFSDDALELLCQYSDSTQELCALQKTALSELAQCSEEVIQILLRGAARSCYQYPWFQISNLAQYTVDQIKLLLFSNPKSTWTELQVSYFLSDEAQHCYDRKFIAPKDFACCSADKMPYLITQSALECYQLGLNMRDLVETSYFLETIQLVTSESALTCYRNEWVSPSILLNHDLLRKHGTELIKILISEQAQVCYTLGIKGSELANYSLDVIQKLISSDAQSFYAHHEQESQLLESYLQQIHQEVQDEHHDDNIQFMGGEPRQDDA